MKILLLLTVLGTIMSFPDRPTRDIRRSCVGRILPAPCAEFWDHNTVFIGTVKQLVKEPFPEGKGVEWQDYRRIRATVIVDEVFRGQLGSEVVFEMEDCYFEFVEGEKYLIYSNKARDGKLSLHRSLNRTRLLSEAQDDLQYIRSIPDAPSGGQISGTVYDHRETPRLRLDGESYSTTRTMAEVNVYLRNSERVFQTVSDAAGTFEFTRVPPGEYELNTDLPKYLGGSQERVRVVDKGCQKVVMWIQGTGEIKGRVLDANGEPVRAGIVSIFSADGVSDEMFIRVRRHTMTRVETDKDGSFRFVRLPSGRYHLAVNMVDEERREGSAASQYPRMFYPGVQSFKAATPIVLADGATLDKIEFKLPGL